MARLSEEFLLAWSSLSGIESVPGWNAISLPPAGSVEVQAGRRSPTNSEAVLFCFQYAALARSEKLPEAKGFLVERADSIGDKGVRLALSRRAAGSPELFASMVCDIVGALDDAVAGGGSEITLLRVLIGRVIAWQRFMSRGTSYLGAEAELGLAGELTFLTMLLDLKIPSEMILSAWVGPEDAPQDFLLGYGAVEVKATMSSSGFPVTIGSLEQLDDTVASPLFLAALKFVPREEGYTLPEIISAVERRVGADLGALNSLREKLLAAGYADSHSSQYTRRFELKESRIFSVSEGFPRLTLGTVPNGVSRALYEINLDHAGDFLSDLDTALGLLGVIA